MAATEEELMKLPGIGKYTARAVLCFAFNRQVAVVDTNIRKLIMIEFQISNLQFQISNKDLWEVAERLLPVGRAHEWNQALMDYAGAVLKGEKILIPKQSRFLGSRRFYRGMVVQELIARREVGVMELGFLIKKDFSEGERGWLKELLLELEGEGFLRMGEERVELT
jgi:A/G-specific adenine glycosylase